MGYDNVNLLTRLLGHTYRPHQNLNHMAPSRHLDRLATLLRLSSQELLDRTIHSAAAALVLQRAGSPPASSCDHKTALRYFTAQTVPICPTCFRENHRPYERLLWSFRPLQVCIEHACTLVSRCPACSRILPPSRGDLLRCPCGKELLECPPIKVSAQAVASARIVEKWLRQDCQAVPGMSSPALFWLAERLTMAIGKTPSWMSRSADPFKIDPTTCSELLRWVAAVQFLDAWPDNLYLFLDEFQRVAKNRTLSTGVARSFGFLLRDAARLEGLGYPAPAEALRQYLLRHYAAGQLNRKVVLFRQPKHQRLLDRKQWYSQTDAARVLELRHGAVADLVRRGVLDGHVQPAGNGGRHIGVVSKRSVEVLKQILDTGLTVRRARRRLGIGRSQIFSLIHAGLLGSAVRTRRGWIIPQGGVQALEAFVRNLPRLLSARSSWLSLRQATRVYGPSGLTLTQALEWTQDGRIAARVDGRYPDLRSLWLFQPDLQAQLPVLRARQYQVSGYPLSQVGKILLPVHSCREPVLKKWIQAGILRAQRQGRALVVVPQEIDRFRAEYCLAEEACSFLGIHRTTLSRWESSGLIKPVYGKRTSPGAGFSLFRRIDLHEL